MPVEKKPYQENATHIVASTLFDFFSLFLLKMRIPHVGETAHSCTGVWQWKTRYVNLDHWEA